MNKIIYILFMMLSVNLVNSQSFIIVGDTLSNNITYVNLKDTTLPFIARSTSNYKLDVDFDGINDIMFSRSHSSSPGFSQLSYYISSLDSVQLVRQLGVVNNCDTLNIDSIISRNSNWNSGFNSGKLFYSFSGPPQPWGPGQSQSGICKIKNNFIGFRKFNGTDTLYGWVLLDLSGNNYEIKSFAVSKLYSLVNVKELVSDIEFKLFPNPSSGVINVQSTQVSFTSEAPKLFNLNGSKINCEFTLINSHTYRANVDEIANGIYFMLIQTNNGYLKKQLVVSH